MCGIMLVLKAVFNFPARNANPRGPMCFRCLMINLSRPCKLLFLLCLMDLSCGECDVISLYFMCFYVNGSFCLLCCVLDSVCKLFGETICNMFGCGDYLLLNVMAVLNVGGGVMLDRQCMVFQRKCLLCL